MNRTSLKSAVSVTMKESRHSGMESSCSHTRLATTENYSAIIARRALQAFRVFMAGLLLLSLSAQAQVYQTRPQYDNPVSAKNTSSNAFATLFSGTTYSSTNYPTEAGSHRYKIATFSAGAPFSSSPPDFNFGDIITPPPLTDTSVPPTIVTTNGAFYMVSKKQLIAAQGGACTILWPTLSGGTNSITYNIGSVPTVSASRLFWTDNYTPGGIDTNYTRVADNTDYAVSLSGVYARLHFNQTIPDFDLVNSQNTPDSRTARANNAVSHLDLNAIWIDGNSVLRARNATGYFIVEYFDTSGYANSVGYEVVYASPAHIFQTPVVLGQRLLPSEGAAVAGTLSPSISKAGSYVTQWSANGSHFNNWIFAVQVNSDATHPAGDSSKTQVLWQRKGNLNVIWPYEAQWYSITWPGDEMATTFVYDASDPSGGPRASIPTNYTATVVWSESANMVLQADSASAQITPVGDGRALIQYQNNQDVWFIPVRVAARTNGAYYGNQEATWPVGVPLQPVDTPPQIQFNGADNYLSFYSALQPGLTMEMWINPSAVTNNQTLAALLDYPQQATVQSVLSLTNGQVQLSVLTNPSHTNSGIVLANGNFNTQTYGDANGYVTNLPGWNFSGAVGANLDGAGPFANNGRSQDGGEVAFLQGQSSINRTVQGLVPGVAYTLSFSYNARTGNTPHIQVKTDNTVQLDASVTPVGGTVAYRTASILFTNTANSLVLSFAQTASGDNSLLLDNVRITSTNDSVVLTSTNTIVAGAWSHIAFTKTSDGTLQLFVNGIPDVSIGVPSFNGQTPSASTYAQTSIGKSLTINGAAHSALAGFAGQISEVRMWIQDQSASSIAANMSAELVGNEPSLAHLLRPAGLQSYTAAQGTSGASFLVPDVVDGTLISGYGSLSTSGTVPYSLQNQLAFDGATNWAEFPLAWNRLDNRTIEFWFRPDVITTQSVFSVSTAASTNLLIGFAGGRLALSTNGTAFVSGSTTIPAGEYHHVSVTCTNGIATLYLDGAQQAVLALAGTGNTTLGSKVYLGTGWRSASFASLHGEIIDLRVYSAVRSLSQISEDGIMMPDLTDPTLVRLYEFTQVSSGMAGSESVLLVPDAARGYSATYHGTLTYGDAVYDGSPGQFTGGTIRSGTAYHSGIYTAEGRIIPVNDTPTNSLLEVWWNQNFTAQYLGQPFQIPSSVTRYRLIDPLAPPTLVIAGQKDSGYPIPSTWTEPVVYYQNDPNVAGYNPNEEHALLVSSSVYALRWDLNQDSSSHGYVLLQYKDQSSSLSYLQPIRVIPTNSIYPNFDGSLLVGQLLQPPEPMINLPQSHLSGPFAGEDPSHRLFQDRQDFWWAQSAVSSGAPDSVPVRWYYPLQAGFYWPTNLGAVPIGQAVPFGNTSNGIPIRYVISYPDSIPHLALGQTLSDAVPDSSGYNGYLPAVTGQKSVAILFDEATQSGKSSCVLVDGTNPSSASLHDLNNLGTATEVDFGKTYFTQLPPHLRERIYWDPLTLKLYFTGAIVRPTTGFPYILPAWDGGPGMGTNDYVTLLNLSGSSSWQTAVSQLRQNANVIPDAETPFDTLVLMPTGQAGGHVTLGMNTRQSLNQTGDPISLYPIIIDTNLLYKGQVVVIYSANKFDQYTTLRHSGDFGGNPGQFQFEWRYTFPVEGQVPTSSPGGADWFAYAPVLAGLNNIVFGGPGLLTLKDIYFSCRWRCAAAGAPNTNWSEWTDPVLVQSWLTRATDGLSPYNQRFTSLANNSVDLTTSILSEAGKRFVGAVPLNSDNADNYGLIETYETLLLQARNLSIDAGYSDDDVNASLLDTASKLNDLYVMLGDEAYSDAKDPTIAWGTRDLNSIYFGSRASSLFAFQGIVPSLLEEELALLRGTDDSTSTPVSTYPVYNRLYWNFTKGINSGEPAYALNYGIPDVAGDADGTISEADAAKLYPQGHGDSYGHYLTALMEYYRLLNNTNFTWMPRAEVKVIGGVNVTFDYVDERKMAAAALQRSLSAVDIIEATFRRDYNFNPTQRGPLFQDGNTNRAWAAAEWCDRASEGTLYDWIVVNSLLPAPSPVDTPQTISRATVPELAQLAGLERTIQDKCDAIDRGDSPLEVAANVVPFDLDPSLLDQGVSHFEQIYARAVTAMQSAYSVLQRASESAANLRRQNVSLETFRYQVQQREAEFGSQLVDLYGTPYEDDIGPSGTFASGYTGADLYHYNYVDHDIFSAADAGAVTNVSFHAQYSITGNSMDTLSAVGTNITYLINSDGIPSTPAAWTGRRSVYGKIQAALGDYIRAFINVRSVIAQQTEMTQELEARLQRLRDHNAYSASYGAIGDSLSQQKQTADLLQELSDSVAATLEAQKEAAEQVADTSSDATPKSVIVGLADGGDLSFPARIALGVGKIASVLGLTSAQGIAQLSSYAAGKASTTLDSQISDNESAFEAAEYQSQTAMETSILLSRVNAQRDTIYAAAVTFKQAYQAYTTLVTKGNQLQMDLVAFRAGNAARIQEARYADSVFRTFRNDELDEYLDSFDIAARYAYAAARVYDYETGLLDPAVVSGQTGDFMGDVMKARQLGDMVNGLPVPGTSAALTLASVLRQMQANWATLKGRFGINNPTLEMHKISLRQELFRIGNSTNSVEQDNYDAAWQNKLYTCKVADIRQVAEFKNYCQLYSPMQSNEPALVIPFSTEITAGKNVFGLPLAGGDTTFDPAHFTTKVRGATVAYLNYSQSVGGTLTKSPRLYLVPVGIDRQRAPLSGGTGIRDWQVVDQVWPIPYPAASGSVGLPLQNLGTDNLHVIRRFPPMRAYDDAALSAMPSLPYDARLVGRSVWNTRWVLIIPASSLSSDTSTSLDSFIQGVTDIKLLLATYSYSGN